MAIKFRKSIKIAPGVRMNVGKKGVGFSAGVRGARVSTSSRGTNVSVGIPGSGVSSSHRISSSKSKRPQRTQYDRIQDKQGKATATNKARLSVEQYNAHVEMLTTMHLEPSSIIDWEERAACPPPFESREDGPSYMLANKILNQFKPSLRDRFFNRVEQRKFSLQQLLVDAEVEDKKILSDWNLSIEQTQKILANDLAEFEQILKNYRPFDDIEDLQGKVSYTFPHPGTVIARLEIESNDTVPEKTLSLTATGKLSEKKMAKGKYLLLYQDFVSSGMLRIAREFFSLLPMQTVIVHTYGYSQAVAPPEYGCILSIKVNRADLEDINWESIDCSEMIEQFDHNMKFLKTKGFKLIEEVQLL
ncbi:DUF4236 domain-containing protein [Paenisporosarcina sp. TG-14]|uniref:DUF4236 domain-containing protein n=1 Tax=Paenisporosarcina sp. TG-14 TaxID=1231057 RepID=UPI00036B0052|nr:DUF4236 domain-containing protein [Paenisporosarcina sp. TG-14]